MLSDETRLSTVVPPRLEITPEQALMDEPVRIRVLGCPPHQRVRLTAQMTDDGGRQWISRATYEADTEGTVDLAAHAPLDGSYTGRDPMGLFWSMTPASHPHRRDYFTHLRPYPTTVTLEMDARPMATACLERTFLGPHVLKQPVRTDGLVGTLFAPAGASRSPGILVLGGSEGGLPEALAALLASHGYATLALAYHGVEPLPRTFVEIPLEYFATALAWMHRQPQIEPDKLAVVGVSKGGELALLLGATFPAVKAVVGYAASAVVYQGRDLKHQRSSWSWQGKPVPFVPYYYPPGMALRFLWSAVTRTPSPLLPMHAGILSFGVFVASVPATYEALLSLLCTGPLCNHPTQASVQFVQQLQALGLSVQAFSIYYMLLNIVFVCAYFLVAIYLFWRRSDDWMALFASFFLMTFTLTFSSDTLIATPYWLFQFVIFLGAVSIVVFFHLFPTGRFVPRWTRWLSIGVILYWSLKYFLPPLSQ